MTEGVRPSQAVPYAHPEGATRPYEVCGTDCEECARLVWWEEMKRAEWAS